VIKIWKFAGIFVLLGFWWFFPTRSVVLMGKFHWIDKANLQSEIEPVLTGGFFRFSLNKLQQRVMLVDGVESVDLWRCWPGDIVIRLKARTPMLRWHQDGLVDKNGILFYSSYKVKGVDKLPDLKTPMQKIPQAVRLFVAFSKLLNHKYSIQSIEYKPVKGWLVHSKNGLNIVLGQEHMLKRLKHFKTYLPKVKWRYRHSSILVDLRYTRGFSVKEL